MTESDNRSRATKWAERLRIKLINEFGGKCKGCGTKEKLQFAHKVGFRLKFGRGRGKVQRISEVRDHPEWFELFCDKCHLEYDRNNPLTEEEKVKAEEYANPVPF